MKKKIVIKIKIQCYKCRTKAFATAASQQGVEKIERDEKVEDNMVVTGNGVDVFKLMKRLKKKFGHVQVEKIEDVKAEEKKKDNREEPKREAPIPHQYPYSYCPHYYVAYEPYYPDAGGCHIM